MTSDAERIERVAQGSRRKRDLAAAGIPPNERRTAAEKRSSETFRRTWDWAERNVPERATAFAATAYEMLDWRHRKYGSIEPTPAAVRERLDALYGERSFKRFYEGAA